MLTIYLNNGRTLNIGRSILILICAIFVIIAGFFVLQYATKGQLVITTNNQDNLISVTRVYNYNQNVYGNTPASKSVVNGKSVRLDAGTYSVVVSSATFSSQQIVKVQARKTTKITINLGQVSTLDPVSGNATSDVVASSNELMYIDPTTNRLYQVNAQNNEQIISGDVALSSVQWASTSLGVGQDSSGNLFSVLNGVVKPLNPAFTFIPSPLTEYAVAPNGEVYIATSSSLYQGTIGGSYKKIASLDNPVSSMSASNQGVAFFDGKDNDDQETKTSEESSFNVINNLGQTHQISDGEVTQISWSATGKYISAMVNGQLVIWTNTLSQLSSLPNNGITSMAWLDDNTLFYGLGTGVWSYNLYLNRSVLVAQPTTGQTVTWVGPSTDGAYLYVSLEDQQQSTLTYEFARVGLQKQPPLNPAVMGSLSVILPNSISGCSLGYLNFTEQSVIIQNSTSQQCIQTAQTYLNSYGINPSEVNYGFVGGP